MAAPPRRKYLVGFEDVGLPNWTEVEFLDMPADLRICIVCGVVSSKISTLSCHHTICKLCLQKIDEGPFITCPVDKTATKSDRIRHEKIQSNCLLVLAVACLNSKNGCSFTGTLGEMTGHLSKCEYQKILCQACGKMITTCEVLKHSQSDCLQKRPKPVSSPEEKGDSNEKVDVNESFDVYAKTISENISKMNQHIEAVSQDTLHKFKDVEADLETVRNQQSSFASIMQSISSLKDEISFISENMTSDIQAVRKDIAKAQEEDVLFAKKDTKEVCEKLKQEIEDLLKDISELLENQTPVDVHLKEIQNLSDFALKFQEILLDNDNKTTTEKLKFFVTEIQHMKESLIRIENEKVLDKIKDLSELLSDLQMVKGDKKLDIQEDFKKLGAEYTEVFNNLDREIEAIRQNDNQFQNERERFQEKIAEEFGNIQDELSSVEEDIEIVKNIVAGIISKYDKNNTEELSERLTSVQAEVDDLENSMKAVKAIRDSAGQLTKDFATKVLELKNDLKNTERERANRIAEQDELLKRIEAMASEATYLKSKNGGLEPEFSQKLLLIESDIMKFQDCVNLYTEKIQGECMELLQVKNKLSSLQEKFKKLTCRDQDDSSKDKIDEDLQRLKSTLDSCQGIIKGVCDKVKDYDELKEVAFLIKDNLNEYGTFKQNILTLRESLQEKLAVLETTDSESRYKTLFKTVKDIYDRVVASSYTWHITPFSKLILEAQEGKSALQWSESFYTGVQGYKMILKVSLDKESSSDSSLLLRVYICLQAGIYDSILAWPVNRKITVALIDQKAGRRYKEKVVLPRQLSGKDIGFFKRPFGDRLEGYPVTLVSLNELKSDPGRLLKNDCVLIDLSTTELQMS